MLKDYEDKQIRDPHHRIRELLTEAEIIENKYLNGIVSSEEDEARIVSLLRAVDRLEFDEIPKQEMKPKLVETIWVVGEILSFHDRSWILQGVFSTEEIARAACKETNWFIGPVPLDSELPPEPMIWPGAYYPNR